MPIIYSVGNASSPEGDGPKIIAHICNDGGNSNQDFFPVISALWKTPQQAYKAWHKNPENPLFELGRVQFVNVEPDLWIANMIGQHGTRKKAGVPPIRYEAIEAALGRLKAFAKAKEASVHMPRIGVGYAGGDWDKIEAIVEKGLVDEGIVVTVYDEAKE